MIIVRESNRIVLDLQTSDALQLIRHLADCLNRCGDTHASQIMAASEIDRPSCLTILVRK